MAAYIQDREAITPVMQPRVNQADPQQLLYAVEHTKAQGSIELVLVAGQQLQVINALQQRKKANQVTMGILKFSSRLAPIA